MVTSALRRRDDRGASIILAMVFMVVCSLSVLGLSSSATNDLRNVAKFGGARTLHTAESSTMDLALYQVRYTPSTCPVSLASQTTPIQLTIDGLTIDVWCSTISTPLSTTSRQVNLYACADSSVAANNTAAICSALPDLTVKATFNDYPTTYTAPMSTECTFNCGDAMVVNSWIFR